MATEEGAGEANAGGAMGEGSVRAAPIEQPAGDAPGKQIRFTLHERTLRGPVVGRFAFDRNACELNELRVGAIISREVSAERC